MVFSSLIFLFAYLCVTLLVYYLAPRRLRNLVLFVVSLAFYGWGEPVYIAVMLFSVSTAYGFGFLIDRYRTKAPTIAKRWLTVSVAVNLSVLLIFKYANFVIENLACIPIFSGLAPIEGLELPIGISFYTFQIISYSIDLYRHETEVQKNYIAFGTYVALFPQLIAGPIVRYRDVDEQLRSRRESIDSFSGGIERFCIGLSKKILLGDSLAALYVYFKDAAVFESSVLGAWTIVLCFTLHIYYDFSGYSDMAIGLGKLFGFTFLENFNYPYIAKSITEFWRRWHMSLGTWFREYVYIPLGGNRRGLPRQLLNLAIVWLLTGLWHGASWNYVLWGVFFCVLLIIEKIFLLKYLEKLPAFFSHFYTMLLVGIGWIIFSFKDLGTGWQTFLALFGVGTDCFATAIGGYEVLRHLPLLLIALVGVTPTPAALAKRLACRYPKARIAVPFLIVLLLLLCTAYMVNSTFSPFLYFEF